MNNEEKKAIQMIKNQKEEVDDALIAMEIPENYIGEDVEQEYLEWQKNAEIILNLIEKQQKEIEDKKEEIYAIAKTNYILGQTDERNQWYKKINEKYKELTQEEKDTDGIVMNTKEKKILKELIGEEK